jgi:hypothetical protein
MKNKLLYFYIAIILFLLTNITTAQKSTLSNIHFETKDNEVIIYYDLSGDKKDEYEVEIFLKSEADLLFKLTPINLSGDIGEGYFVGKGRKILWQYTRDLGAPLDGDEYYFEINVTRLGGIPWYYYVGGTALAGGLAAILVIKKDEGESKTPIKEPPDRP